MDEAFNSKAAELSWDWNNFDSRVQSPYSIITDIVRVKTGENPQATDWQSFQNLSSLEEYNNLEFSNMEKPSWENCVAGMMRCSQRSPLLMVRCSLAMVKLKHKTTM